MIAVLLPGVASHVRWSTAAACVAGQVLCVLAFDGRPPVHVVEPGWLRTMWLANWLGALALGATWALRFSRALARAEAEARSEHERASLLLSNVLPASIVERLKSGEREVADAFGEVTVLFADLVGFTKLAATRSPHDLVALLDRLFSHVDALAEQHGVEKIKTIGDAYMAAAGVPDPDGAPAARMASFALELRDSFAAFDDGGAGLRLRIGLATGPAVAGVIGRRKFSYDLWGDTVNTASRMESHGEPGRIHVDERTQAALGAGWRFEDRGTIEVKGKGPMRTLFLEGRA